MQKLIQYNDLFRISRPAAATAVWLALLAWPCCLLQGKEPEAWEFKYDPEKALVFIANPEQARLPQRVGPGPQPSLATAPFDSDRAKKHQQAWADTLSLPAEYINSIGMKLVLIPAGEFQMGSGKSPAEIAHTFQLDAVAAEYLTDEHPQHKVEITKPFYMSTTEVTQGQWETVMDTRPWEGKSYVKESNDYPASYLGWEDAVAFCRKLSAKEGTPYRLPTEAEWEYSCRAGTTSVYHFGDDVKQLGVYAWFKRNRDDANEAYAHAAGLKKPNAFGLYDMSGNVLEWCQDWYAEDYYAKSPTDDPQGPKEGSERVHRGGCWYDPAMSCRSADRSGFNPSIRRSLLGFRVVRSPLSADQEQARQQCRRQAQQEFDEPFNQGDWIESNEENVLQQVFTPVTLRRQSNGEIRSTDRCAE